MSIGLGAPLIWTALSLLLVVLPKPAANCDGGLDCIGGVKAEAALKARATSGARRVILVNMCCCLPLVVLSAAAGLMRLNWKARVDELVACGLAQLSAGCRLALFQAPDWTAASRCRLATSLGLGNACHSGLDVLIAVSTAVKSAIEVG